MTFAARLRELRLAAGLSRKELAATSGLSPGAIRDYEQGIRKPSFDNAICIAAALGTSCEAFAECVKLPASKAPAGKVKPGRKRTAANE